MGLAAEFLNHARSLATSSKRPSQINLRRAVSAAYYAVFHLLISQVTEKLVPSRPSGLRARASRAFAHAELKEVCKSLRTGTPPDRLRDLYGNGVSEGLRRICDTFVTLQEARHQADYDIAHRLEQSNVLGQIELAEDLFRRWTSIRGTEEANIFLCHLTFNKRWDKS